jgi:signal recognition particle GTPase
MDPNQTYRDIVDAMTDQDHETARALALALRRWIASGGFLPSGYSEQEVEALIRDVLLQTDYLND